MTESSLTPNEEPLGDGPDRVLADDVPPPPPSTPAPTRRWFRRRYLVVALVLVAIAFVARGREPAPVPSVAGPTVVLDVTGASEIEAGSDWVLEIEPPAAGSAAATATQLDVHVTGPWGVRTLHLDRPDDWTVTVPGELTRRSGTLTAAIRVGDAAGTGFVDVRPLDAVDGAIPLAGPRSIVADFDHWTMVSAFPRDRYGNVVADGTVVVVHVRRPDGTVERVETEVEYLLSAARVYSRSLAGRTALRMDTEGATGPEVEVLEVPGPPVSVTLIEPTVPLRADGRMLVTITSDVLVDQYNNVLLDGTSGVVRMDGPLGVGTLRPSTIEGRFEFVIEAPPVPGVVLLDIEVDGVRSEQIALDFVNDVLEIPVAIERVDGDVEIVLGEVLSVHGGYVPDGTTAFVRAPGVDTERDIFDGMVEFVIDVEPDEVIEIEVLGTAIEVEAP